MFEDMTEEDLERMTEDIHYDRMCSEYCGNCGVRHHPEQACPEYRSERS